MKVIVCHLILLLFVLSSAAQVKVTVKKRDGKRVVTEENGKEYVMTDSMIQKMQGTLKLGSFPDSGDTLSEPKIEISFKRGDDGNMIIDTVAVKKAKNMYNRKYERYLSAFLLNKPYPAFVLKDLSGKEWTEKDLAGKVTLINTWNIHCGPCKREMPVLNKLMKAYPDCRFIAVSPDSPAQVKEVLYKIPFRFTQLTEAKEFLNRNHLKSFPVNILVDKAGVVRYVICGAEPESHERLKKALERLRGE